MEFGSGSLTKGLGLVLDQWQSLVSRGASGRQFVPWYESRGGESGELILVDDAALGVAIQVALEVDEREGVSISGGRRGHLLPGTVAQLAAPAQVERN